MTETTSSLIRLINNIQQVRGQDDVLVWCECEDAKKAIKAMGDAGNSPVLGDEVRSSPARCEISVGDKSSPTEQPVQESDEEQEAMTVIQMINKLEELPNDYTVHINTGKAVLGITGAKDIGGDYFSQVFLEHFDHDANDAVPMRESSQPDESSREAFMAWYDPCGIGLIHQKDAMSEKLAWAAWQAGRSSSPKRESGSEWNTMAIKPSGAYGIDVSKPLVFRTEEQTSKHVHLRLGYYNCADDVFYGSGETRAWKEHEVTHWHLLPPTDVEV